jgi:hypothetical protein
MLYLIRKSTHIDITQLPSPDKLHDQDEYTIGDTHGNALYLLHFLLTKNILVTDRETFNQFATLYKAHDGHIKKFKENNTLLNKTAIVKDLIHFHSLLDKMQINHEAIRKKIKVRLIGDELADRGADDYLTLRLLERLVEGHIHLEIIISNHGLEFLRAFHHRDYSFGLGPGQSDSMINLNTLLTASIIATSQIEELYKKIYFKHLVAIGYQIDPQNSKQMVLYTHAPVPSRIVKDLCRYLCTFFDSNDLPKTIDTINLRFLQLIQNPNDFDHYFPLIGDIVYNAEHPLDSLVWCRMEDDNDISNLLRPRQIYDYLLTYVHGHHNKGKVPQHKQAYVYNLDGMLGMWDNTVGEYAVLTCSTELN